MSKNSSSKTLSSEIIRLDLSAGFFGRPNSGKLQKKEKLKDKEAKDKEAKELDQEKSDIDFQLREKDKAIFELNVCVFTLFFPF